MTEEIPFPPWTRKRYEVRKALKEWAEATTPEYEPVTQEEQAMPVEQHWFRCRRCGVTKKRRTAYRCSERPLADDCLPCGGVLERCEPPEEAVLPARPEWLGRIATESSGRDETALHQRALQHLIARA